MSEVELMTPVKKASTIRDRMLHSAVMTTKTTITTTTTTTTTATTYNYNKNQVSLSMDVANAWLVSFRNSFHSVVLMEGPPKEWRTKKDERLEDDQLAPGDVT